MEQPLTTPRFDDFGLLVNPTDWSPELAIDIARRESVPHLGDMHWAFIEALRDYYFSYQAPPPAAMICHELKLGTWCAHDLFNNMLSAWRIAGLPDPGEEAKSYMSAE